MNINAIKSQIEKSRLPSIWISVMPIFMATSLAYGDGIENIFKAIISLIVICIIHTILAYTLYGKNISKITETLIFLIFGPAAVSGSYYFQSNEINLAILLSGFSLGLFALNIYNIPETNKTISNKYKYLATIFIALVMPILIYTITRDHICSLLASLSILIFIRPIVTILTGKSRGIAIRITIKAACVYTVLFSLGWIY
ncbi:MAG: hypothetical protein P9X22_00630 [Candidatus Zapsychrus exili]|nr:hypothetical protein [Candidatus Zapsychrus exili]